MDQKLKEICLHRFSIHELSRFTKFVLRSTCYQMIDNRLKYLEANSINFVTFENWNQGIRISAIIFSNLTSFTVKYRAKN